MALESSAHSQESGRTSFGYVELVAFLEQQVKRTKKKEEKNKEIRKEIKEWKERKKERKKNDKNNKIKQNKTELEKQGEREKIYIYIHNERCCPFSSSTL